ncbi:hypothetical protein CPC08DRAFT_723875 [Agrocybe pediades]|nr:hypothetical protein CPC08DRAFT_723875 [Agrocybe pediades]
MVYHCHRSECDVVHQGETMKRCAVCWYAAYCSLMCLMIDLQDHSASCDLRKARYGAALQYHTANWHSQQYHDTIQRLVDGHELLRIASVLPPRRRRKWLRRLTSRICFEVILAERPEIGNEDIHDPHHFLQYITMYIKSVKNLCPYEANGILEAHLSPDLPPYAFGIIYRVVGQTTETFCTFKGVAAQDIFNLAEQRYRRRREGGTD